MMKWQYAVTDKEEQLDEWGADGWELVSVIPDNGRHLFYFKRPQATLQERLTEEQRQNVYHKQNEGEY